jgi:hypothetical protein
MTDEKPPCGKHGEHRRFRIFLLALRRGEGFARRDAAGLPKEERIDQGGGLRGHLFERMAAPIEDTNVAQFHVFDVVTGDAGDDGCVTRVRIGNNHVADAHAPDGTGGHALRRAQATAQAEEKRRIRDVPHGDIRDDNVLDKCAIHGFECEAARPVEDDIRDGDVAEIAFRFRPDLDAAGGSVAVGRGLDGPLVSGIEQRADFVSADEAVGDRYILRGAREAERVRSFEGDRIVVGGVDARIRDTNVAAGVDIDPVAVGVDGQIVDGEVVDTGREDAEVPSPGDGKIAQSYVAAEFERDYLVSRAAAVAC